MKNAHVLPHSEFDRPLDHIAADEHGVAAAQRLRHVDAGYSRAAEVAAERGVRVPMEPLIRDGQEG